MLSALISVGGLLTGVASTVSGIWQSKALKDVQRSLGHIETRVEHILSTLDYLPDVYSVQKAEPDAQHGALCTAAARRALAAIAAAVPESLVSSAVIKAPPLLTSRLSASPSDVLLDIQPLHRSLHGHEEDLVPLVFERPQGHFVGWQKKGVLPFLLGINYCDDLRSLLISPLITPVLEPRGHLSPKDRFGRFLSLRYGDTEAKIDSALGAPGKIILGDNKTKGHSFFDAGLVFWVEVGTQRIYNIDLHSNPATEASPLLNDCSSDPHAMLGKREQQIRQVYGDDCRVMTNLPHVDIIMYDFGGLNQRTLMPAPVSAFFSFPKMHDVCVRISLTWYDFRKLR